MQCWPEPCTNLWHCSKTLLGQNGSPNHLNLMLHRLHPVLLAHLLSLGASLELVRWLGKNPNDCQIQYGTAAARSWLHSVHKSEHSHICGFFYPTFPHGTGQGIWSTLNSSQMLTSFCVSHQMATIFVVNIRVGGRGWALWPADEVIVFIGAAWNQVWPAKPFPDSYQNIHRFFS